MNFSGFLALLGLCWIPLAPMAQAFNSTYECVAAAETSVGYARVSSEVTAKAGKVKNPYTVRLSGVSGTNDRAVLHAQQTVPLVKIMATTDVIWFAEQAPAGTIIIWTLFEKYDNGPRVGHQPVTLISTKSYSLGGAASFTAFYKCK